MQSKDIRPLFFERTLRLLLVLSVLLTPCMGFASKKESKTKKWRHELAIGAIFRDEAPYLKEWIEYHLLIGVDHFYLYNNLSTDHYKEVLEPYIKKGIVELTDWNFNYEHISRWSPIQCSAYTDILKKARDKVHWLAVIDTDEFIVPLKVKNLLTVLAAYENFGSVAVNWQMFGTSHVEEIPSNKLMIETLFLKAPVDFAENIHVKNIVHPDCATIFESPHYCNLKPGFKQVNTNKEPFMGPFSPYVATQDLVIHHYWTRDNKYLQSKKMNRRSSWQEGADGVLNRANQLNQLEDRTMMRFVPELRKKVFQDKVKNASS